MSRWIIVLLIMLAIALAQSKMPVSLGGADSLSLLKTISNNSSISSAIPNATNNSSLNLSNGLLTAQLGGYGGMDLFQNLTNGSSLKAAGPEDNLSSWGSTPRKTPLPPKYDPKQQQMIQVIKDNHIA